MMVPKTTSETLKHKINPSLDVTSPQAVDVLCYTPGQYGQRFKCDGPAVILSVQSLQDTLCDYSSSCCGCRDK